MLADAKPSKAVTGKLKSLEQGRIARAARLRRIADLDRQEREALDAGLTDRKREEIAKKQSKRMRNVVVEMKKKPR
jgi:hypothetical protein